MASEAENGMVVDALAAVEAELTDDVEVWYEVLGGPAEGKGEGKGKEPDKGKGAGNGKGKVIGRAWNKAKALAAQGVTKGNGKWTCLSKGKGKGKDKGKDKGKGNEAEEIGKGAGNGKDKGKSKAK